MQKRSLSRITVRRKAGDSSRGWLIAGMLALPVALGRGGIKANKREGDGGTPRGTFRLRQLWWRADKHPRPATSLPVQRITPGDGWCEDPADRR
ncbi:MAG: L,D-transpeptidase family protein, partial [Pseudolabrys sp.]